jgi:hypothetical protein
MKLRPGRTVMGARCFAGAELTIAGRRRLDFAADGPLDYARPAPVTDACMKLEEKEQCPV